MHRFYFTRQRMLNFVDFRVFLKNFALQRLKIKIKIKIKI